MRARCRFGFAFAVSCVFLLLTSTREVAGIEPAADAPQPLETAPAQTAPAENGFVEPQPGHQNHHPHGFWYLGVYGNYTDTGLVLTEIYPHTTAARAGLEVGDRIVAVGGHQIGVLIHGRLDLDVALQQYTRPNGWVRLLIQDRRTQRLLNFDVLLTRGRVHI